MSDYGTMKARIAQEMRRGDLSACATAVQDSVLSAIKFYERRRFPFNEFHDEVQTAIASATYTTLSTTAAPIIFAVDSMNAVIGSRDYPLRKATWHELNSVDSGQWFGYPEFYAIRNKDIRLYPPPNNAVTLLRIAGIKQLSLSASAQSATNAWLTDAEELIRLHAKANLFRDELRNYDESANLHREAQRVYRELTRETRAKSSAGRVRSTKW